MRSPRPLRFPVLLLPLLLAACRGAVEPPPPDAALPPGALPDIVATLRQDLATPRGPADGGGRAWLEPTREQRAGVPASELERFTLLYEAGPLGIAAGGALYLQVSPFWGWSTPQVERPDAAGYTELETDAEGVGLEAETVDQGLLRITVAGRGLAAGERVRIVYGAGALGAMTDRYAEHGSRFWFAVDGDGDGVRGVLADSPTVDVIAGPPRRTIATLPSVARPGEEVRLVVAVLDALGNAGAAVEGEVRLACRDLLAPAATPSPCPLPLPARFRLAPADAGRREITFPAGAEGVFAIETAGPGPLAGVSNPMVVAPDVPLLRWGDLHGHSGLSDGTGTPADYLTYARDVAALDVIALTDHDHWGIEPLDTHPALWREIEQEVRRFHEPGRFVTLLGYEWTSWIHGHRHVLYFGDEGRVLSSIDPAFDTPAKLWNALRGQRALTFAHHSAGGPIPTDWSIPPDPELEPVTEVVSVHGASEAPDAPAPIYRPLAGNYVRDALARGYRLGFVGSGDSHDGHPGLAALGAASGGLAAIYTDELTRDGVLAALKARRVYATNGPRIVLQVSLAGHRMGSAVAAAGLPPEGPPLDLLAVAPAPIHRVDLVSGGQIVQSLDGGGRQVLRWSTVVAPLAAGSYLYVRVVQEDGGAAWSSPFYVE